MNRKEKRDESYFKAEAIWQEYIKQNCNIKMYEFAEKFKCSVYYVSKILTAKFKQTKTRSE